MRRRFKLRRKANKRNFCRSARKVHSRNLPRRVMRGGIRL
nr:hypothetical protein JQWJAGXB_JQWJAGXB_CDS_0002 [Microvirus sp.]